MTQASSRHRVLVLGGGPAGSAVAILAAERGFPVTLVERARFPRDKVCGEFLSAEGCGVLARLGVLDRLVASGATSIDRCRLTDRHGTALDVVLPPLVAGQAGIGISRRRMDSALLDRARAAGVEVRERWEAVEPLLDSGRVVGCRLRPVGSTARIQEFSAGVVVAADGRRSTMLRHLQPRLGDPRRTTPRSWFGLKVHLASADASGTLAGPGRRIELHLFDGGYVGLGQIEDGRINLCLMVRVQALRDCGGSPGRLLAERVRANPAVERCLGSAEVCSDWQSVGPLRFGTRRPSTAGALFVGDAAGTIDPFCGEGMSHALLGAELALPAVESAMIHGRLGSEAARDYRDRWHAAFAPVTRRVRGLGHVLERPRLAEPLLALIRRAAPAVSRRLVAATRTGQRRQNRAVHGG
jgi:flavin-dependent dehydrogenase